jgi:hypothetical protein
MQKNGKRRAEELKRLREMYRYCLDMVKMYKFRARLYKKRIEKLENEAIGV